MIALILMLAMEPADPWQARFPEDDVVVIEHTTRITIHEGYSVTRHRRVTRPLTISGREDHSDIRIGYFAPRQELRALRCRTRTAAGDSLEATPHAFNVVTPHGYGTAPDFLGFREMVVSPPAVAEGVQIVLEYELVDSATVPWFEDVLPVGEAFPVMSRTISVENLTALPLRWKTLAIECGAPGRDGDAWVWSFSDIPAHPEPSRKEDVPRLAVSTCPGWADMARWFSTSGPSSAGMPPDALDSLRTHLRLAVTLHDSLRAIADVAANAFRIVPSPDRRFWACRDLDAILACGYAEPLEAAWFMASLADSARIAAHPCFVGAPLPSDAPPSVTMLPEVRVMVPGPSPYWLTHRGPSVSPAGGEGFSSLLLTSDAALSTVPAPQARWGHVVVAVTPLRADTLRFRGSIALSRSLVPADAAVSMPEEWCAPRVKRALPGSSPSFRATRLDDHEVTYEFEGSAIGEGIWIDCGMRTWFGDGWVPGGTAAFDPPPRTRLCVPTEVELSVDLRIVRTPEVAVRCARKPSSSRGGGATLDVSTGHTEHAWRIVRTFALSAGWREPPEAEQMRRVFAAEGRRSESAVFIPPSP